MKPAAVPNISAELDARRAGVLNVVLCWHMHQPDYRHRGVFLRPWTWLHAIKDYSDMAAHLEALPQARAVVNFSPLLLEQLQDYAQRMQAHLASGEAVGDALLDALSTGAGERNDPALLRSLLRVNEARMKDRFVPYARLHAMAKSAVENGTELDRRDLEDLLVWYVLVWLGESLRGESLVLELTAKAEGFSGTDRRALFAMLADVIGNLLPRYRRLADQGRIELSVTPYSHPILPLLVSLDAAREAWSEVSLPAMRYPGGTERCEWQMSEAQRVFRSVFGREPAGCWPSEGGLSGATLELLARREFRWTASGERVLRNSLHGGQAHDEFPHLRAWRLAGQVEIAAPPVTCFFRDDGLSDLIGFEYSKWPAQAAVEDFIRRLEGVGPGRSSSPAVLSIIMDGENAWEYFEHNGWQFLEGLYQRLSTHPRLHLTTFSTILDGLEVNDLPHLCAGSWVHGNFSTWIGDAAKNRAWELLARAKSAVDAALAPVINEATRQGDPLPGWVEAVLHQLAVCEASDWFWWLGADNRLEDGPAFDLLFRQQLAGLYQLIGMVPPDILDQPINRVLAVESWQTHVAPGETSAAAGAMRPAATGGFQKSQGSQGSQG